MNSEDFYAAADSPTAGDLPERFTALAAANYLEADTPELEQLLPRLRRRRLGRNLMNTGVTLTTLFAVAGLVLTASHLAQGESANPAERGGRISRFIRLRAGVSLRNRGGTFCANFGRD